ncbi:MAG: polysaccharide deacetylase family protein [Candidatus Eiseniibacteriota bacterium]
MSLLQRPDVQRWLGGYLLCRVGGSGPCFAATFDDGPSVRNTPRLLDTLARHGAHATFFVMAWRAKRHADLMRRMVDEGHEIGVHGELHVPAFMMPRLWLDREVRRTGEAIVAATGIAPRYYRAPFGPLWPGQAGQVRRLGLTPVLGSVYPVDPHVHDAELIAARVLARLGPGDILILHDSSPHFDFDRTPTLEAADAILRATATGGLKATTISGLLASSR